MHPYICNLKMKYLLLPFLLFFLSCDNSDEALDQTPTFFEAVYDNNMNSLAIDNSLFEGAFVEGEVDFSQIDEASGLAVSRHNKDYLWTHNDSGDLNRIFLLHKDGTYQGSFRLLGTGNRDWEDMAIASGPDASLNYLYIADIGDNDAKYNVKHIYRLPEPSLELANNQVQWVELEGAERISFVYPEGKKMDAETLFVDPLTLDIYIVTKREFPVTVYRLAYPQSTTETTVAEKYGTLPFTMATGGDISTSGEEIVIKTKERIFMWKRTLNESIADAFMREPIRLPYLPEPQGEAIAFDKDDATYYTLSETRGGIAPKVYSYTRK